MMKRSEKIWLWSMFAIGVLTVVVLGVRRKRQKENSAKIENKNPKKILIVGDSQSAIKSASGAPISYTYPNLLKNLYPDKSIDVLALVGKTTSWMLENLPNMLSKTKYDRVYIYGGGNDVSNSSIPISKTLSNIQKMVNLSKANGADVFVNLGYKVEGDFGNYKIMPITPFIKTREQWIPIVEKRKQLQVAMPEAITDANFIEPYSLNSFTSDGIHPNANGHKLVAEVYAKTLKSNEA